MIGIMPTAGFGGGGHWDIRGAPAIKTRKNATDVLDTAGVVLQGSWPNDDELIKLAKGISAFAGRVEATYGSSVSGLKHISSMLPDGTVNWHRKTGPDKDRFFNSCGFGKPVACALNDGVEFYEDLFSQSPQRIAAVAVHEMAHIIHFACKVSCEGIREGRDKFMALGVSPTSYATDRKNGVPGWEYWAESVGVWVFRNDYPDLDINLLDANSSDLIDWVTSIFRPPKNPENDFVKALQ